MFLLSFPVRTECEGLNFSWLRWRVCTSLIFIICGSLLFSLAGTYGLHFCSAMCFPTWTCLCPPLALWHEWHTSQPWHRAGQREAAEGLPPPWLRGKSRRAWLPHGQDASSVDSAPPPLQSRLWDESWACLGVQVSVRGHSTRTSLSSAVNTTVTGALTSQSLESASVLPALPHCQRPQGPLRQPFTRPQWPSQGASIWITVLTSLNYLLNVQVRDHSFLMLFYHLPLLPLVGPRVDQPTLREKDLPRAESQRSLAMCLLNPVLSSNSPPTNRCTESAAKSKTERKCKNPQGLL